MTSTTTVSSASCRELRSVVLALTRDEVGQDLIEYALLSAFIGIVSVAVWGVIEGRLGGAYAGFDAGTQGLWETPAPAGP